jgi:hypothetical protein
LVEYGSAQYDMRVDVHDLVSKAAREMHRGVVGLPLHACCVDNSYSLTTDRHSFNFV